MSVVRKEFQKAASEEWKSEPPWKRYQKKLIQDLAVLNQYMENAITFVQYEKLNTEGDFYCIRHPESNKNIRIIYVIRENAVILLTAFLEKKDGDYKKAIRLARKRLKEIES